MCRCADPDELKKIVVLAFAWVYIWRNHVILICAYFPRRSIDVLSLLLLRMRST